MVILFLLSLVMPILGEITLSILTQNPGISIKNFGNEVHVIKPDESERFFGLNPDMKCRYKIGNVTGQVPDICYLKEPTPGDLFTTNDWPELKSVSVIQSIELISESQNLIVLKENSFENDSNFSLSVDLETKLIIIDSIIHEKILIDAFQLEGKIKVEYTSIIGKDGDGGNETSYLHSLGTDEEKILEKSLEFGTDSVMNVPPGGNLTVTIYGYEGTAEYEVIFGNYLTGRIIGYYNNTKFEDRHYKAFTALELGFPIKLYKERLRVRYQCGKNISISDILPASMETNRMEVIETLHSE